MNLLYPVLRTLLICLVGFAIAFQGRRMGYSIFNLTGRLNRLQYFILFMTLMFLYYGISVIEYRLYDYIVTLPAYWGTRILIGLLQAVLFPLACALFTRRIHDIGFNGWAGILWATIITFINTYIAVMPLNYFLDLFIWLIGLLFWILPGQPTPNQYGYPPFMHQPKTEPTDTSTIAEDINIRKPGKTIRKRRNKDK